jgi:DNA-binding FadR family transcriptional regulator
MAKQVLELAPLRAPHLYEQIVERIKREIADGRLQPGARLPSERDLAQALQVSRPSVREAVAALQNAEILETRHGAGSFVSERAPELVLEETAAGMFDASPLALLDVREILEPEIAARAAEAARRDQLIEQLLDEMDQITGLDDRAERRRWSDADRAFHRQLAVVAGNPVLLAVAEHLASLMDQPLWRRLRDESIAVPGRTTLQLAEHRLIAAAVADGDAAAARRHTAQHIDRARRFMALD